MGRSPCCDGEGLKKGPWTPEEDKKLVDYIERHGHGSWRALPRHAGLNRCGKSCRLRWTNYLRPDIKRGKFTDDEEHLIINFHAVLGNKWSAIATRLPGRTDNEIKNYWNTHLRKKLLQMGIDPVTHRPRPDLRLLVDLPGLLQAAASLGILPPAAAASSTHWNDVNVLGRLQADAAQLAGMQLLQGLVLQAITAANSSPTTVDMASLLDAAAVLGGYPPAGELLQQQGRPFQVLLDGSAAAATGLGQGAPALHGSIPLQMPVNGAQQLLAQCSLQLPEGEASSPKVSRSENTNSVGISQMPGSGNNNPAASVSMTASTSMGAPVTTSENISLDQFWEMIKHSKVDGAVVSPDSSTLSFETWGTLADAENELPCWQDIDQPSTFAEFGITW